MIMEACNSQDLQLANWRPKNIDAWVQTPENQDGVSSGLKAIKQPTQDARGAHVSGSHQRQERISLSQFKKSGQNSLLLSRVSENLLVLFRP